jgi:hypothetical protein
MDHVRAFKAPQQATDCCLGIIAQGAYQTAARFQASVGETLGLKLAAKKQALDFHPTPGGFQFGSSAPGSLSASDDFNSLTRRHQWFWR